MKSEIKNFNHFINQLDERMHLFLIVQVKDLDSPDVNQSEELPENIFFNSIASNTKDANIYSLTLHHI